MNEDSTHDRNDDDEATYIIRLTVKDQNFEFEGPRLDKALVMFREWLHAVGANTETASAIRRIQAATTRTRASNEALATVVEDTTPTPTAKKKVK